MNMSTLSDPAKAVVSEELIGFKARLKWREDDMRLAVAEAIMDGDDTRVSILLPSILELSALRSGIELRLPIKDQSTPTPVPQFTPSLPSPEPTAVLGRRVFGLRVFLAGAKIEERTDACTFASAIYAMGCHAVADLRLVANYCPLVSRERQRPRFGGYRRQMQISQRGEWFIVTHSSTSKKAEVLNEIARRLHVELIAETSWMV